MSALARWFAGQGRLVAGYDRTPTPLTAELESEGIHIHFEDNPALIGETFLQDAARTLVIYTPAVPKDHQELNFFRHKGFQVEKRSRVLGMITENLTSVAVAGTHGKTTTSALVSHILHSAGVPTVAFVGGITANYNSNLIQSELDEDRPLTAVVEADEFDRSFLQLTPDVAILTSLDPDHLDIYGTPAEMVESYRAFIHRIKTGGKLILNNKLVDKVGTVREDLDTTLYGLEEGEAKAVNVVPEEGGFRFDLIHEDFTLMSVLLQMPGYHNVENAVAAACAACAVGVQDTQIRTGLESFKGVHRRFESWLSGSGPVLVDDYAHHPTEIDAFIRSIRGMHPGRKVTAIFQPHLFSRTRDFAEGFGQALSIADEVVLLDIYPARELPIPGITSGTIAQHLSVPNHWTSMEGFPSLLPRLDTDVVLTIGAGDIYRLLPEIKNTLLTKPQAHLA